VYQSGAWQTDVLPDNIPLPPGASSPTANQQMSQQIPGEIMPGSDLAVLPPSM
jgi:hypothetical protein